jgi:ABC-type multidrug transport system fused ATPase/permease subunit
MSINFNVTLLVFVLFGAFIFIMHHLSKKKLFAYNQLIEEYRSTLNQHTIQSFGLIKIIKIFAKEKFISNFFKDSNFKMLNNIFKSDLILQIPRILIETFVILIICGIIIYSISSGSSALEIIPLISIYAAVAIRLMPSISRIISSTQRLKVYLPQMRIVFNEYHKDKEFKKKDTFIFSSIKFVNVSFRYNNNFIFENLNIEIQKGKTIGIFADSGIGKSTFANLISGLIYQSSGEIIYNGNIKNNENMSMTPLLGYVPQLVNLFDDTIWNNVTFFSDKTEESIIKFDLAIKQANIFNFIQSLNEKENTKIGESSSKISGGQAQRIGIARALFVKSDFLIFDESATSLDSDNEREIFNTIYSLKNTKTIVIISHNKEQLNRCDKIYTISSRKLLEVKL